MLSSTATNNKTKKLAKPSTKTQSTNTYERDTSLDDLTRAIKILDTTITEMKMKTEVQLNTLTRRLDEISLDMACDIATSKAKNTRTNDSNVTNTLRSMDKRLEVLEDRIPVPESLIETMVPEINKALVGHLKDRDSEQCTINYHELEPALDKLLSNQNSTLDHVKAIEEQCKKIDTTTKIVNAIVVGSSIQSNNVISDTSEHCPKTNIESQSTTQDNVITEEPTISPIGYNIAMPNLLERRFEDIQIDEVIDILSSEPQLAGAKLSETPFC